MIINLGHQVLTYKQCESHRL